MIQTTALTASYDGKKMLHFPDWQLPAGAQSLMLGPSGSGKTTLLHLLAGLLRPQNGEVVVAGTALGSLKPAQLDHFRGQHIGLVFQKPHLLDSLTVRENLLAAQYFAQLKQDKKRIGEVLEELNLAHKLEAKVTALSQGEAQRVAIARALLNKPQVILADEPTSALDDANCEAVANLLLQQAQKYRATLVISTHDHRLKSKIPNQLVL